MSIQYKQKFKEKIINPFFAYKRTDSGKLEGIEVPDVSMFGMIKMSADAHPAAPAYDYYGTRCTYQKLIERIETASRGYSSLGVKCGDIVTIMMPNTPEALVSIYALNRIGAVCNIIHPLSATEEIKKYLNSVQSKVLLCIDLCCDKVAAVINETQLTNVVVACASDSMNYALKLGYSLTTKNKDAYPKYDKRYIRWNSFIKNASTEANPHIPTISNDSPAIILHSGGTTGTPKEIVLSNRNFNAFGVQSVITLYDIGVGDKVLAILPIFHGFGLGVCIHVTLCFGACSVLIPRFNSKEFGSLLKKHRPTMIFGVPTLYEAMLGAKGIDNLDFSFLKYAVCGGDSLPASLEDRVNDFLKEHNSSTKICEGYGMTESLAAVCLSVNGGYKSGTLGKPLIGNSICVVTPGTTDVLPHDTDGEICINGPTVMMYYRNNKDETSTALKIHSDGKLWLHTGDIGSVDADGFIHYKLRLKRLIITSGYNVYPQNIESTIESLPFVNKCVAVGIPHPYKKEVAKAYILLNENEAPSEDKKRKIYDFCKQNLAHYSIPYELEFIDEIPKTPLGKTDFMSLKNRNTEASA